MVQAREEELIDYPVIRYVSEKDSFVDDHKYTSMECYLDIYLNGKRFTTSFCSPGDHTDLVIGILAQMGQIRTYDDIVRMDIDEETLQATVVTTAEAQAWAAGNATDPRYFRAREILDCEPEKIFERPRDVRFKAGDILACADKLLAELAATHEKTNGVHSGIISGTSRPRRSSSSARTSAATTYSTSSTDGRCATMSTSRTRSSSSAGAVRRR